MSWNWLDVVVVLLTVGQIGLVVAIGMIAMRIKNGPVARFASAVGRNVSSGKKLIETGRKASQTSLPHILRTRAALVRLPASLRPITLTDAPITYASLSQPLALLGTVRGLRGGQVKTSQRPVVKAGVAERLGLVPPAWKKVTPYLGYLGTAHAVWQEVQKQLPEIRRALSERDSA
jgi:hypothetical protein